MCHISSERKRYHANIVIYTMIVSNKMYAKKKECFPVENGPKVCIYLNKIIIQKYRSQSHWHEAFKKKKRRLNCLVSFTNRINNDSVCHVHAFAQVILQ